MSDEESREETGEGCRKHHHRHGRTYAGQGLGVVWCIGWLFSIGYLHMPFFWKGVLAIIIWPYYLGAALARPPL